MLQLMNDKRIFYVNHEGNGFEITENCDSHFSVKLTRHELRRLGEELIKLSDSTSPSEQGGWKMIKRYEVNPRDGYCDEYESGDWVKFEDHEKEVERLKAALEIAEKALEKIRDYKWTHGNSCHAAEAIAKIYQLKQQPKKDE